mmetsp:Transcript_32615/g.52875  ORF Transcript_32615/g.52875 Transcript_32615/m.52875 type:complete len:231 (-) Transcript_32615:2941-3633(-)
MYVLLSCTTAWNHASTNSSWARTGDAASCCGTSVDMEDTDSYDRCRFRLTPGGASNVILRDCSSRMVANLGWGSEVSHRRKLSCRWMVLRVFSSVGSHVVTRWRFLRHTQSPTSAASLSIWSAISACPWPMASWRYFAAPTVLSAISSSSWDGSAPGVVISSMASPAVLSSIYTPDRFTTPAPTLLIPNSSHANTPIALSRRSGLKAWTTSRRSKGVTLLMYLGGNSISH